MKTQTNPFGFNTGDLLLLGGAAFLLMTGTGKLLLDSWLKKGVGLPGITPAHDPAGPGSDSFRILNASPTVQGRTLSVTVSLAHTGPGEMPFKVAVWIDRPAGIFGRSVGAYAEGQFTFLNNPTEQEYSPTLTMPEFDVMKMALIPGVWDITVQIQTITGTQVTPEFRRERALQL